MSISAEFEHKIEGIFQAMSSGKMLVFERIDFTGSTEDVTDRAEGVQSDELIQ